MVSKGESSPNGPRIQVSEIFFHLPRSWHYFLHMRIDLDAVLIMTSNVRHSHLNDAHQFGEPGNHPTWRQVSAIFSLVNGFISVRFTEWNVWDMDGMLTGCYQWVPPKKVVFLGTIMILYDGLLVGI